MMIGPSPLLPLFPFTPNWVVGGFAYPRNEVGIQSLTNVQKLSLPANTAVGPPGVSVTDGFVVSGFGDARDGLYCDSGALGDGKPIYVRLLPYVGDDTITTCQYRAVSTAWRFLDPVSGSSLAAGANVDFPWLADWSEIGVTVTTPPTLQQLTAPSTAQGGVFVAGGTQDGVYTDRGVGPLAGKRYYNLLGASDGENLSVTWRTVTLSDDSTVEAWAVYDSGDEKLYYSLSDVATPDLAGSDKFVMSVSGVAYSQRGTFNSKAYYNKIGSTTSTALNAIFWSSATWHITNASGVDLDTSTSTVATPDLATFLLGTVVTNTAWLNASNNSPASIVVASITQGELDAGMIMDGVVYFVSGNLNGRLGYSDVAASEVDTSYTGTRWSGAFTSNLGNTAFPWQATWPDTTVTRDNVASEANWQIAP